MTKQPLAILVPELLRSRGFKDTLVFPKTFFDITIGLMLGDLSATKRYPNSIACLKFTQSIKHQGYLLHLYLLFELYCGSPPRVGGSHCETRGLSTSNVSDSFLPIFRGSLSTFLCGWCKRGSR